MARTPTADVVVTVRQAAQRVLGQVGFERLTIRAVATEAGVSPQVVYSRFGRREAILDDVAIAGFRQLIDRILGLGLAPLSSIADPLAALVESFRRYRAFATADPELHRFLFDGIGAGFEPSPRAREAQHEVLDLFAAAAANAIRTGMLLPGSPPQISGRLLAVANGAIRLEAAGLATRADFDAALATMVRGLRPSAQLR